MNRVVALPLFVLLLMACAGPSQNTSELPTTPPPARPTAPGRPRVFDFQISVGDTVLVAKPPSSKRPEVHALSDRQIALRATVKDSQRVRFVARLIPKDRPAIIIGPVVPTVDGTAVATWMLPSPDTVYIVWAEAFKRPDAPLVQGDGFDQDGNWVAASQPVQVKALH